MNALKWRALGCWWLFWIVAGVALDRWMARRYGQDTSWLTDDGDGLGAALDLDLPTGGLNP